jgi:pectinesterase
MKGKDKFTVISTHLTKQNNTKGFAFIGNYSQTIKDTAQANSSILLDIETRSIELANRLGEDKWKDYWLAVDPAKYPYYKDRTGTLDKPDITHFQEQGAKAVAKLVADEIQKTPKLKALSESINN